MAKTIAAAAIGLCLGIGSVYVYQMHWRVVQIEANMGQIVQWINSQQPAQKAPQTGGEVK